MRPKARPKPVSISVQASTTDEAVAVDHGYVEESWETVLETQLTQKFDSDSESDSDYSDSDFSDSEDELDEAEFREICFRAGGPMAIAKKCFGGNVQVVGRGVPRKMA